MGEGFFQGVIHGFPERFNVESFAARPAAKAHLFSGSPQNQFVSTLRAEWCFLIIVFHVHDRLSLNLGVTFSTDSHAS